MDDRERKSRLSVNRDRHFSGIGNIVRGVKEEASAEYWNEDYEKKVSNTRKWIDKLMRFQMEAELTLDLKDCFDAWYAYYSLREDGELAGMVLGNFHQGGGIADTLTALKAFISEIDPNDPEETADEIRMEVYYNHVFFLKHNLEKLMWHVQEEKEKQECELPAKDQKTVLWFVKNECGNVAALRDLPAAREAAVRILEKYQEPEGSEYGQETGYMMHRRTKIEQDDMEQIRFVLSARDLLAAEKRNDKPNCQLQEKTKIFKEKTEVRKKNIEESQKILQAVSGELTTEWFSAWDPRIEENAICRMDPAQLKKFYLQHLEAVSVQMYCVK